ncbi:glycerol-3-phosphate 1-O-acyltransferase PlsY [Burkholderiaceae bacterium UC74_6]
MQNVLFPLLAAIAAYLIGSLSFAVIVSRVMGLSDPRSYGSGNPGATNVLRSGNKVAAVLTLIFDALKGAIPVLAVRFYGTSFGLEEGTEALVALAAFLGHLWPVFFKFVGGKGVATAAGAILALNWMLGLVTLAIWLIVAFITRYSSLAALVAAVFAPLGQLLIFEAGPAAGALIVMGLLLVWRHQANIKKLMAGTESRLGQKSSAAAASAAAPAAHKSKKGKH